MTKEQHKEIAAFLANVRDDQRDVEKCVEFLYTLLHRKTGSVPPVVEIVAVIKYEKPVLFRHLKNRVQIQQRLKMIFDLSMDYGLAKERLEINHAK